MISDLAYNNRDPYISNQVKSRPTYLLSGLDATSIYTRGFYYLINTWTSIIDKVDIYIRKKF